MAWERSSDDPSYVCVAHMRIHPQLQTQHQLIGSNIHPTLAAGKQNRTAGIPNPGAGQTQLMNGLHPPYSDTIANHIMEVNESGNIDALALTSPPLASLDLSPTRTANDAHTVAPSHTQSSNAAPARVRTASEIETETRAAIWATHHTSLYELKESVESLLATLWARDTDPRELQGMFDALSEEVKRTRERLVIN